MHKALNMKGQNIACKLQYPDMESIVEADINQLKLVFKIYRQIDSSIDTSNILKELSYRVREELDYEREKKIFYFILKFLRIIMKLKCQKFLIVYQQKSYFQWNG